MKADAKCLMLIIASTEELSPSSRIWGTGGWLEPTAREALDWLTLAILSGWKPSLWRLSEAVGSEVFDAPNAWIVVACDPDLLSDDLVDHLAAQLQTRGLCILARAGTRERKWSRLAGVHGGGERYSGKLLRWIGPGPEKSWGCRADLTFQALQLTDPTSVLATLDDARVVVARPVGHGTVVTLGFHPSEARDQAGCATAFLRHMLCSVPRRVIPSTDWNGTVVLRMDDPGASQNVHLRSWLSPKLSGAQWADIGLILRRRKARLSIGYVSGWVDSGEGAGSELSIAGEPAERVGGRVHPSPLVRYRSASGEIHDGEAEYRGIESLRAAGLAEVELHGYTHLHPNLAEWLRASDRFENERWFRELGRAAEPVLAALWPNDHPLRRGMDAIRRFFHVTPTTLICPGEEFTNPALEVALDLGLRLVGSYYLGIRADNHLCWAQHVCAPYLDTPDPAWFDSGLPVVGYFHDRDLALEGVDWLARCLDAWEAAGATRFINYRELAIACAGDPHHQSPQQ